MELLFWSVVGLLCYTWFGYHLLLSLLVKVRSGGNPEIVQSDDLTRVTVIVPAYDEESVIQSRIRNLLESEYARDHLEIIIGSDGSSDRTVQIARTFAHQGVKVMDVPENRGRADVHNDCIKVASGDIVVFTDSESLFDSRCISELVRPFSSPMVGAVIGRLKYMTDGSAVGEAEGLYWKEELRLKELEHELGIVNNGLGACMAIRKHLFRRLRPFDDVDTATVLDILLDGYAVFYQKKAVAYDVPPLSARSEFKMRVRGTSKTVTSVWHRASIRSWLRRPAIAWSFFSHRILRYCTGTLMLAAVVANFFLARKHGTYQLLLVLQAIFYLFVVIGAAANHCGKRIPLGSLAFSFNVAMLGMTVGVIKALAGRAPSSYKMN